MKTRLWVIFGVSVVGLVIILLAMTIILNDFKSVIIPSTSVHLSKVEACNLINGDWDLVHKTCDDVDIVSCAWLDGQYQECKSPEYKCPLDNPNCMTTLSCISTCLFEQSLSANIELVQKELENPLEPDLILSPKSSKGTITYEKIFTEDGPLQVCKIQEDGDKNCGSPVLDEENCVRYTVWLNEFQKEKLHRTEDFSRYPPWGNQIFPLVTYCESVGEFYHVLIEDSTTEIIWSFVSDEQNKDKIIAGFEYSSNTRLTIQKQESYCEERNAFRTGTNACRYNIHPSDCSDNGFDYKRGNCIPDYG